MTTESTSFPVCLEGLPEAPSRRSTSADVYLDSALETLDRDPREVAELARLLAPDEKRRAARFVRELHRSRFTAGRATLRLHLAQRLGVPPASIELTYGAHGKPALGGRLEGSLCFNLSHSDAAALYVFSDQPVGCDIERIRPLPELEQIVGTWFAPSEAALITSADDRAGLFFRYWTAKEAVLKAIGTGVTLLARDFELRSHDHATFRSAGTGAVEGWTAVSYGAPAGFAAALAYPSMRRDEVTE